MLQNSRDQLKGKGYSWPLFLYFGLYYTVYLIQIMVNTIADDRIWTSDLWCR